MRNKNKVINQSHSLFPDPEYYDIKAMLSPSYNWKQWDTVELLRMIRSCAVSSSCSDIDRWPPATEEIINIIRKELATRPHIPNSKQSKEIRRQKAKEQRNR